MVPQEAFGQVLREFRTARGVSQLRLAQLSHLDRTYISLLERGERQPSLTTMINLAKALDMSLVGLTKAVEERLRHDR
jgi:transcriptional regulator with XRE-family HTH domain